jgi:superfamily II DNA helicase RecQ
MDVYYTNRPSIKGTIIEHLQSIKDKGIVPLMKISASFKAQLEELTRTSADIEKNPAVQERFQKAILYFRKHFKMYIQNPLEEITFSTDNKTVRKELEKHLQILQKLAVAKQYCLTGFTDQFNAKKYLKIRANAVLQEVEKPKKQVINYLGDPVLSVKLRELRSEIAGTENIPHFQIFTQKTLYEICEVLPRTTQQLLQVHGMGKIRVEKYGGEILEIIRLYEKNQKLQVKKA